MNDPKLLNLQKDLDSQPQGNWMMILEKLANGLSNGKWVSIQMLINKLKKFYLVGR